MEKHENFDKWFSPATAIQAEGARVGLTTCKLCGACVMLDPREEVNAARLHGEWHESQGHEAP